MFTSYARQDFSPSWHQATADERAIAQKYLSEETARDLLKAKTNLAGSHNEEILMYATHIAQQVASGIATCQCDGNSQSMAADSIYDNYDVAETIACRTVALINDVLTGGIS